MKNGSTKNEIPEMEIIAPEFLRELDVQLHDHPRGKAWPSAAGGLVCKGGHAYVIADDEHSLGTLPLPEQSAGSAREPLMLIRIFEGDLPEDKKQRKHAKSDIESLSLLPSTPAHQHGGLLAMGSGRTAVNALPVLPLTEADDPKIASQVLRVTVPMP